MQHYLQIKVGICCIWNTVYLLVQLFGFMLSLQTVLVILAIIANPQDKMCKLLVWNHLLSSVNSRRIVVFITMFANTNSANCTEHTRICLSVAGQWVLCRTILRHCVEPVCDIVVNHSVVLCRTILCYGTEPFCGIV